MRVRLQTAMLVAGICLATMAASHPGDGEEKAAPKTRTFELTYLVTIPDVGGKRLDVWLPSPESDDNQTIEVISVETPFPSKKHQEEKYGNWMYHFGADDPGAGPFVATMKFRVERREVIRKDLDADVAAMPLDGLAELQKYLGPNRLVPVDGPVKDIADGLAVGEKSPLRIARALYDHVIEKMRYDKTGEGWGTGSTDWACTAGYGNCTDFHAFFISLARARKIPARFTIGFPLPPERGEGTICGYHCWADFFVPGPGWIPVDISEADKDPELYEYYFGAHSENRVAFTRGRDLQLEPAQKGPPLNYFIYPYAEVDGKPFTGFETEYRYEDLTAAGKSG